MKNPESQFKPPGLAHPPVPIRGSDHSAVCMTATVGDGINGFWGTQDLRETVTSIAKAFIRQLNGMLSDRLDHCGRPVWNTELGLDFLHMEFNGLR